MPRTVAHQAPPAMEFFRQQYCSGFSFPSPGDLPDQGSNPVSALRAEALPLEPPGKPQLRSIYLFTFKNPQECGSLLNQEKVTRGHPDSGQRDTPDQSLDNFEKNNNPLRIEDFCILFSCPILKEGHDFIEEVFQVCFLHFYAKN